MMQKNNKQKGFTLVELLVVVLVIGILAAVAWPAYQTAVAKSQFAELITLATAINKERQVFSMANGSMPTFEVMGFSMPGCSIGGTYKKDLTCSSKKTVCHIDIGYVSCIRNEELGYVLFGEGNFSYDVQGYSRQCYAKGNIPNRVCRSLGGKLQGFGNGYSIYDLGGHKTTSS